jgi:FkbM family methyltransferase
MYYPRIFIDGGGNWRRIVDRYLKLATFDEVYVFEPNPIFHESYEGSDYTLIKKAMWTEDGHLPLYISKDDNQVASSLLEEKLCKVDSKVVPYWLENPVEVPCVDFSGWLKQTFYDDISFYPVPPDITLKLDIEGAEYDVLWKMIKDGTIEMISDLFVEFHLDTLPEKAETQMELIKALHAVGLPPQEWD